MLFLGSFLVANPMVRVLFDSVNSFSFISKSFAMKIGNRPTKLAFRLDVMTPLGEHSLARKYLWSVNIKLGDKDFKASLIVMDMKEYDVILGIDWLM